MGWEAVRGHEALIQGFRRVVQRGRLAHAYLFVGPVGVGKRLFAVELARALLCEKPSGVLQACGSCPSCVQLDAGTHPDYFPAARPADLLEFPIDLMRQLCASFALKSARGRGKVIIVDDADDLNEESANCFLKTLEEPPAGAVLILIGSSPERQLPTIISRCQVVRFAPLSGEIVNDILKSQEIDDLAFRARLVRLSGGSPGLAMTLSEDGLWEFRKSFLAALVKVPLDPVEAMKLFLAYVEAAGKESAAQRRRASLVIRLLVAFLDDTLTLSLGGEPRQSLEDDRATLAALAVRVGPETLIEALERCLEADHQIDRRVQLVLVLEALIDALTGLLGRSEPGRSPR